MALRRKLEHRLCRAVAEILVRLRWLFGRPWSRRALDMCFRLAVLYAFVYLVISIEVLRSDSKPRTQWSFAGFFLVFGPTSFLVAR